MAAEIGAAAISGGVGILGPIISGLFTQQGNREANAQNQRLAQDQQKWNLNQWQRETNQEMEFWNMQNTYNSGLWDKQNKYNEGRWNTQNSYNEQMWDKQNKYNSPQMQMARLKEAGLSPHLMYGKGSTGEAGSQESHSMRGSMQESNGLKSPDVKGYSRANVQSINRGVDMFGDMIRLKNIQAQTDNTEANTDIARQEALLKGQDGLLKSLMLDQGELKFSIAKELRDTQVSSQLENLEMLKAQVQKHSADAHVAQQTKGTRISTATATLRGKNLENSLKGESLKLRKQGLQETDPMWIRALYKQYLQHGKKLIK